MFSQVLSNRKLFLRENNYHLISYNSVEKIIIQDTHIRFSCLKSSALGDVELLVSSWTSYIAVINSLLLFQGYNLKSILKWFKVSLYID